MTNVDMREPIPDHPRYSISPNARVFGPKGELKPFLSGSGYPMITAYEPGGAKANVYLGLAAARAYLGEPEPGDELDYIDGDVTNWRLDNLTYRSHDEQPWWRRDEETPLELEYERLTAGRIDNLSCARRERPHGDYGHGRLKTAQWCRNGHPLSMTGEPDHHTDVWGFGNRICLDCLAGKPRVRYVALPEVLV